MDPNELTVDNPTSLVLLDNGESGQFYQTGGYWLMSTQPMNGMFPMNRISGMAFDPCEELIWCITQTGQLTGFYGTTMEPYVTTPITPMSSVVKDGSVEACQLRHVIPSPRLNEHLVYLLAQDALYVYSKFGRPVACSTEMQMQSLECMVACSSTGIQGPSIDGLREFDRLFCGGLQKELLEIDATDNWGQIVRTIDVGPAGCVCLEPFAFGLCAANTQGQVQIIDPRAARGVVRNIEAHTGEISDMTVVNNGYTLVTCGWSRMANSSLRIDRMLNVFDLRMGRSQSPLSALLDPGFLANCHNQPGFLLAASQTGAFQTLLIGDHNKEPGSIGNLLLAGYDRLSSFKVSPNGQCLLFGTESGDLHLYSSDLNSCHFNDSSLDTTFASPFADGVNPPGEIDADESLPAATANIALARQSGKRLHRIAESAANSVLVQAFGRSMHSWMVNEDGPLLTERKKRKAMQEALAVAFKPVAFDDDTFSFTSVPFIAEAPACDAAELSEWICEATGDRRDGCTSDWPPDLCGHLSRQMLDVDPELLKQASTKGVVMKPASMGPVWFPYTPAYFSADQSDFDSSSNLFHAGKKRSEEESYVERMCRQFETEDAA